ncbi:MAG: hypothetical protein P8O23_06760 [Opitutales bacterium]|nr:hypothetical protein [Opitutales bacterium]
MKIIGHTITEEEADLFCERIFWLTQTRPRLREILKLKKDPKHSAIAQKIAKQLVLGKLIVVDNSKNNVFFFQEDKSHEFTDITLLADETPELEIYLYNNRNGKELGPLSLLKLYYQLPTLNLEEFSLWHTGIEDFVNLAELKIRLIG